MPKESKQQIQHPDFYHSVKLKSGFEYAYQEHKGDGTGTIIALPGLGVTSESWEYQLEVFKKNYQRIILLDIPGSGKSDSYQQEISYQKLADDLGEFLEKISSSENFDLAGTSLGGAIATYFSHQQLPYRIDNLILINPALTIEKTFDIQLRLALGKMSKFFQKFEDLALPQKLRQYIDPPLDQFFKYILAQRIFKKLFASDEESAAKRDEFYDYFRDMIYSFSSSSYIHYGELIADHDLVAEFLADKKSRENFGNNVGHVFLFCAADDRVITRPAMQKSSSYLTQVSKESDIKFTELMVAGGHGAQVINSENFNETWGNFVQTPNSQIKDNKSSTRPIKPIESHPCISTNASKTLTT